MKRNNILYHICVPVVCVILASLSACIKNDIPYPRIHANFLTFEVEGASRAALIDSTNNVVTVYLSEEVDIEKVRVATYSVTAGTEISGANLSAPIDLSSDLHLTLSLYQDYDWTIRAQQTIERYFSVENQIGSSVIDVVGKRVVAHIPATISQSAVKVNSIKLWQEGAEVSPDIEGKVVDFTHPVEVSATIFGATEVWTLYVEQTEATVTTVSADGWTSVGYVYGEAEAGKDNGVEYRKESESGWTRAPKEWVTQNGGSFTARLLHLEPMTTYVVRAYSDEDLGAELTFKTGLTLQVPNSSFSLWNLDGKVWNPWGVGETPWWDTGNKGATTLGSSNTAPTEDTPSGNGQCAWLETRFVGIGVVGKLAAGNIFSGKYVATDGTNGILSFGQPFEQRPTKLRGYLKYKSTTINYATTGYEYLKGEPDTCIVWMALSDKDSPYEIRTNPKNLQLFDPDDPTVIAYGKFQSGASIDSYQQFEIELKYNSTSRVPKYIVIVGSASKYGDFFTGGNGSTLYLADLELLYDY